MPGHFLVRDPASPGLLIDAFDSGRPLEHAEAELLLRRSAGPTARLTEDLLEPTGRFAILSRMLMNLDRSFEARGDLLGLAWVSRRRLTIPGMPVGYRVQLAGRLAVLGRLDEAATTLEDAAQKVVAEPDRTRLLRQAASLRARLN
jgi:regulator of sirC expression with transglutaminase-like and TPR domain